MDRGVRAIVSHRLPNAEELKAGCGDWLECCQAYIHGANCGLRASTPPTTPSDAAMRAAEEIADKAHRDHQGEVPHRDVIAAIITRHLAAGQEWLPIETAPRGIDILLLWEDEHMQIHHFPVVEKPSFWFENAPIKWRYLPPLPDAAATPSPETAAAKEGWTPEQFARLMPELSEEERARILAETAVGGEAQKCVKCGHENRVEK